MGFADFYRNTAIKLYIKKYLRTSEERYLTLEANILKKKKKNSSSQNTSDPLTNTYTYVKIFRTAPITVS